MKKKHIIISLILVLVLLSSCVNESIETEGISEALSKSETSEKEENCTESEAVTEESSIESTSESEAATEESSSESTSKSETVTEESSSERASESESVETETEPYEPPFEKHGGELGEKLGELLDKSYKEEIKLFGKGFYAFSFFSNRYSFDITIRDGKLYLGKNEIRYYNLGYTEELEWYIDDGAINADVLEVLEILQNQGCYVVETYESSGLGNLLGLYYLDGKLYTVRYNYPNTNHLIFVHVFEIESVGEEQIIEDVVATD